MNFFKNYLVIYKTYKTSYKYSTLNKKMKKKNNCNM